jgi:hypothetical protein
VAIRRVAGRHARHKVQGRLDRLARRLPGGMLQVFADPTDVSGLSGLP